MNVGIYVGADGAQSGGGHAFVRAVLDGLQLVESPHALKILHSGISDLPSLGWLTAVRVLESPSGSFGRTVADRLRTARASEAIRNERISAELRQLGLHLIWFLTPAAFPTSLPYVATVWDLAHRLEPEFPEVSTTGWSWDSRESHYQQQLPRAAYVAVGTSTLGADVSRCYGVSPSRIRVLPLVAPLRNRDAIPAQPTIGAKPYIYYPAQFWPHKNHVGLLHALKEARDRHGLDVRLVLSGADKGNLSYIRRVVADLALDAHVSFEGFVTDERLALLYANATALVFPSFFGPDNLPPLEAMQLGCPVIAANVPGAAEQLGDAALLVNPRDSSEIAAAIAQLTRNAELRATLVARGRARAAHWTAGDYAAGILRVIDEFETERRCWSPSEPYVHP